MAHADFVHLRLHSAYSLLEGAIQIKSLAELCLAHDMPAVALTDTSNMFGALEFSKVMSGQGIQPIVGCQMAVHRPDGAEAGDLAMLRAGVRNSEPDQLVLLAQNAAGYANLLKLTSRAHLGSAAGETPQVSMADLGEHGEGLIALSAGLSGAVGRLLGEGRRDEAEAVLRQLSEIYRGRLYVELQRHGLSEEERIEGHLVDLAYALDLPLVATNEVFFAEAAMYEAHDVLLCIAGGHTLGHEERRRVTPEHRFKSAAEMRELFSDLPEAVANTLAVARRCAVLSSPREPILPRFETAEGRDEATELRAQAEAGLERRLEKQVFSTDMDEARRQEAAKPYRDRLAYELDVIIQMDFPGYFLIVADFIKWAKAQNIPVGPGRGSGAGSVVAWSLTITDLDPLRFGLLFERFLNPERVSMPDFDIDFCQDRRDEVIRYVQGKYGEDQVAQIITFGTLQARAALRDVGRVLQLPYGQVDRICKLVPANPANPVSLEQALEVEPLLRQACREDERVQEMMDIARKLEGLYRHASTHAAGVVIGDRPLERLVPLYRDPRSDMPVTQFSMKYAEAAGLVKFDFLGLKTLTVLDRARRLVAERGIEVDFANLPYDDRATYDLLSSGTTVGVFQLESSGMRDVLRQMQPDHFEDIIALVALYRPGPMDNIPKYIAVKQGREKADYLHECLEPILRETYGVIIYQEQVMQIAQVLAGYSLGEADLLRRAMGKKIKAEMDAQRARFVDGAVAKGVDRRQASHIFDLVAKFAGYGFNKSHAAAYALVAYQTAWLKANHPVEFMAASMTLDMGNTDKLNGFREELNRMGISLLPPDINRSSDEFSVERQGEGPCAVRYALAALKNVGREAMRAVVAERDRGGPFTGLFDFACRVEPAVLNKRQLENLARSGAFDCLNPNRAQVQASVELLVRHAQAAAEEKESAQSSMFGDSGAIELDQPALPLVDPWDDEEKLRHEFESVGFYLSGHPIDAYAAFNTRKAVTQAADLAARLGSENRALRLTGIVLGIRMLKGRRGSMAFVQMSDASGIFEITVFSELLATRRELLEAGRLLYVEAEGRLDGDQPRIAAIGLSALEAAVESTGMNLIVHLGDSRALAGIRAALSQGGSGKGRVRIVLRLDDLHQDVELEIPEKYAISGRTRAAIRAVQGVIDATVG